MAIQRSIFTLNGTIGGVTFYERYGKFLAKRATSLNKERILSDPAFARTRENYMEFGGCNSMVRAFRMGLSNLIGTMSDKRTFNRLTKQIKQINLKGTGVRGERTIDVVGNNDLLNEFEFVENSPFNSIFGGNYNVEESVGRNSSTITIEAFNPANLLKIPQNATHFRFVNAITVISNYHYDSELKKYQAVDGALNELRAVQYSAYMPVNQEVITDIDIIALLAGSPVISVDVAVINCIGVEFSQEVNTNHFVFAQSNAMKIAKIF